MLNFRSTDLALLVSLNVLLEEANVTRAAQRLNISQPALSAQLARLRELFQDPLLIPAENGRGMTLTAHAMELKAPLAIALAELDTVLHRRSGFDPKQAKRTFSIATSDNMLVTFGLDLISRIQTSAGEEVKVSFRNTSPEAIAGQLEQGDVDLLISSERLVPQSMKARPLLRDRYMVAQRKKHPRGLVQFTMDSYCALGHVLVSSSGGAFSGFVDDQLKSLGRERRVAVSVQAYSAVPLIIERTDLVCVLPSRFLMRFSDRLDILDPPFEIQELSLLAAWHPRNHADPSHIWLREQFSQIADSLVGL